MARVGVLALQGGYAAHEAMLADLGHTVVRVREPADLEGCEGLVLPGGESSTQLKLLPRYALDGPLEAFVRAGHPVLGTCAGLILAAREVQDPAQRSFGWLDVTVSRNAYGRQLDSFESTDDSGRYRLLFIRAPRILACGPEVEVLATLQGEPILVRQGAVYGAAFHPELTRDPWLHAQVFGDAR